MASEHLNTAIEAIKTGNTATALRLLADWVLSNPNDEVAWFWLSVCTAEPARKTYCLMRVLSINPDHVKAREALARLQRSSVLLLGIPIVEPAEQLPSVRLPSEDHPSRDASAIDSASAPKSGATIAASTNAPVIRTPPTFQSSRPSPGKVDVRRTGLGCLLFVLATALWLPICLIGGFTSIGGPVILFGILSFIGIYGILSGLGLIRLSPSQINKASSVSNSLASLLALVFAGLMLLGLVGMVALFAVTATRGVPTKFDGDNNAPSARSDTQAQGKPTITDTLSIKQIAETNIAYDALTRRTESYVGEYLYYRGSIMQVVELQALDAVFVQGPQVILTPGPQLVILVSIRQADGESWTDIVWVNYSGPRLRQGDNVKLWGKVKGRRQYTTPLKLQMTVPELDAIIVELDSESGR